MAPRTLPLGRLNRMWSLGLTSAAASRREVEAELAASLLVASLDGVWTIERGESLLSTRFESQPLATSGGAPRTRSDEGGGSDCHPRRIFGDLPSTGTRSRAAGSGLGCILAAWLAGIGDSHDFRLRKLWLAGRLRLLLPSGKLARLTALPRTRGHGASREAVDGEVDALAPPRAADSFAPTVCTSAVRGVGLRTATPRIKAWICVAAAARTATVRRTASARACAWMVVADDARWASVPLQKMDTSILGARRGRPPACMLAAAKIALAYRW